MGWDRVGRTGREERWEVSHCDFTPNAAWAIDRVSIYHLRLSYSVAGQRYFTCGSKRGVFVRPNKVQVGDYPEVDEFVDSEDEI